MLYIFQDWIANKANPKGRMIATFFRLASLVSEAPNAIKLIMFPYAVFYRVFVEWILGVEIPWKTKIGSGLIIYHGQGLVINDGVKIGCHCILRHNTTIGVGKTDASSADSPIIEDYVDVGANVVIIGKITIGKCSIIGAGSVVVKDVPPYSVVVGNPGKVIKTVREPLINENFQENDV
ncbi:serine O-acetyltransferase [Methylomonas sp. HYX-M1]|uniref:serine O-acetyltransferase n=1 Tax=Methylomonas sp. HYX-M1 TaxID=3139307 RepID=UPI00345B8BAE